jgi:protease-4
MRKRTVVLFAILLFVLYLFSVKDTDKTENTDKKHTKASINPINKGKIALIDIYGEIGDTTYVLKQLHNFSSMKNVKAIVLRINSGGGAMAGSQEVYSLVRKISLNGKPVVVSMGDVAASGAYYIASAADRVVANSGTLTGSIGVIMMYMTARGLLDKIGVDYVTLKTGKYKDIGSFARAATKEEKDLMMSVLKDALSQFVDDIVEVRFEAIAAGAGIKAKNDKVKKRLVKAYMLSNIADGRLFTGNQAYKLGLVDSIGTIDDAIADAAKMAGMEGRPLVVTERYKPTFYGLLESSLAGLGFKSKIPLNGKYSLR